MIDLDPVRHPPELIQLFLDHQRRWRRGEIKLPNYLEQYWVDGDGQQRPLWYTEPLGSRVIVDKAQMFEQLGYRPSEPMCYAHASLAKIRVVSGGARAGKSLWAGMEAVPVVLSPDTRTWIIGPEYDVCRREFEYILDAIETDEIRHQWAPMLKGGRIRNNPKNGDMELKLVWGDAGDSFVRCKSAERKRSLLGEMLDMAIVVEASQLPEVIWSKFIQMRLANRKGSALFPSSPDGTGWYDRLYKSGLAGERGVFAMNADSRMNPTLDLEEIAFWTSRDRMSDVDFDEQVRGVGSPKEGRIYKGFASTVHVVDYDPPADCLRGRAFDFGYKDPYVILHVAKVGEAWLVYREFYETEVLTDQAVEYIGRVEGWEVEHDEASGRLKLGGDGGRREKIELASVADWDAAERADLAQRGVATRKAKKDVLPGIRTVAEHLRVGGNGKSTLLIHERCKNLIRELGTYQWGKGSAPKLGQDDHAVDALRYFLHTLAPKRGRMEIRMVG